MADAVRAIERATGAVRRETVGLGLSGARVLRLLDARGRPVAFVKLVDDARGRLARDLAAETARLEWLARLGVPVPEVLGAGADDGGSWLATRALPGRPASDPWPEGERDSVVDRIARAARELHATAADDAPFDRSLSSVLPEVRERVASGLADRSWEIAGREGPPAAAVLPELESAAEALGDGGPAVTHGDFCLPNVLVAGSGGPGFVDVGRAGTADPHSDVADMARSLRSHMNPQFGPASAERFLDAYGRDRIDPERLRLHDLLESFFWPVPEERGPGG
ncbi:aminoglycoside 3'-phosphotransferase [Nocardiopsis sp. NPDC006198]|uniref:aminoglycoside 3'-phosphotransferase n=1 Tax=Nocardiopsis sp. NPDC006198 TaxID=3154472 RepID=UPI0033A8B705